MKIKVIIFSFCFAVATIFAFNSLFYRMPLFESGIYYGFLKSTLQDGDLNLINNIDPKMGWILSPTYNVPVMHDHGSVLAWAPLGYFANKLDQTQILSLKSSRGTENFLLYSVMLTTLILVFLGMWILKFVVRPQTNFQKILFWIFPLTTPLVYYSFFEFVSADIVVFFWSCCVLYLGSFLNFDRPKESFIWGLLFGLGRVVKISSLFWLPYFIFVILTTNTSVSRTKKFTLFCLGLVGPFILKYVNDYREFGFSTWSHGYWYSFEFPRLTVTENLYQNLFGNYGVFFIGFWLVAGFLFFLINMKSFFSSNKQNIQHWMALALAILIKFAYECLLISNGETEFGFRRYIIDIPIVVWMVVEFWKTDFALSKLGKVLGFMLLGLNFIWAAWYLLWYIDLDRNYYSALGVYRMWEFGNPIAQLWSLLYTFIKACSSYQNLFLATLIFISSYLVIIIFNKFWHSQWKLNVVLFFFAIYFFITGLNILQNPAYVESSKALGKFDSHVISNNLMTLLYDEILSELSRNILIAKYKGDETEFKRNQQVVLKYIASITDTLLVDPVNFGSDLKNGKIRQFYYDNKIDMQSFLDFNTPSYYDKLMGPYKGKNR